MFFRTAALAAFALVCIAQTGRCDDSSTDSGFWKPTGAPSTTGLKVDSNQVMAYCFSNKPTEKVPFACFTLKGDIRQRMRSPQNLKGYISPGGETFVVLAQVGGQSFTTEVERVTLTDRDDQSNCLHVKLDGLPQGAAEDEMGQTFFPSYDRDACPGKPAIHLQDAP